MNLLRLFLFLVLALAAAQTHAEQGPCSASWKKVRVVKLKKLNSSLRIEKSFKKRQTSQCRARSGKARQACLSLSTKQQKKINSLKMKIANIKTLLAECVKPSPTATATATPQPSPTPTATATPTPMTANAVSQWGVSWEFDKAYQIGQFANGDYWVVPPSPQEAVTIVSMSPAYTGGLNGWQVNPLPGADHGLDFRVQGWKSNLVPALPYAAHAGDSIVKTISLPGPCITVDTRCLQTAAVLTVLSQPPPGGGSAYFRPPFSGPNKPLIPISQIRLDRLPSLAPPSGVNIPPLAQVKQTIERVQLEQSLNWIRQLRPTENMPGYGSDISARNSEVALRLVLNDPIEQKMPILIAFLQYGIDLREVFELGGKFPSAGGHGQGRLPALAFTGALLDDSEIAAILESPAPLDFGEVGATFISPVTGQALYGEETPTCSEYQYWLSMFTHAIVQTCPDPYGYIDGGVKPGGVYQTCCSTSFWRSSATLFNIVPSMKALWNDQAFFNYISRWAQSGTLSAPDPCAPAVGFCSGGTNHGAACNTATAETICTGTKSNGTPATCDADMSLYGIAFGPDGQGSCILDLDPSDGIGRFPQQDGTGAGLHWGQSNFQIKMEELYG